MTVRPVWTETLLCGDDDNNNNKTWYVLNTVQEMRLGGQGTHSSSSSVANRLTRKPLSALPAFGTSKPPMSLAKRLSSSFARGLGTRLTWTQCNGSHFVRVYKGWHILYLFHDDFFKKFSSFEIVLRERWFILYLKMPPFRFVSVFALVFFSLMYGAFVECKT